MKFPPPHIHTFLKLIFFLSLFVIDNSSSQLIERSEKLHDRVLVSWTVDLSTETATFEVTAETTGFVGFGLSTQGGMQNADVIIGGVKDGKSYFTDRWATEEKEPKVDDHQDWFLINASENGTHTILQFNRTLDTCDPEDLPITNDTIKFIWSLGSTDEITYHELRGVSNVNILDYDTDSPVDISEFEVWEILVNTTIPTADTSYWCTVHRTPDDFHLERHIVGFQVKMESPESLKHNHHLALHKCLAPPGSDAAALLETYVGKPGGDCYEEDGSSTYLALNYCRTYAYVWAKGGKPLFLPSNVGYPMNEAGWKEYYLMEIHYDNPKVLANVTYETGVQVFTSPQERDDEAGFLMIGHPDSIAMVIPPETDNYQIAGHCSPKCTMQEFPPGGITVFNVLLHSHISGRKLKIRHFRPDESSTNGTFKELPWISYDNNYDFDFQQNRPLREPITILPGDHLTYECTYDSTWRDPPGVVLGGLTTRHEMCVSYLTYYPRMKYLDICSSQHPFDNLIAKFGIEQIDENSDYKDPMVRKPESMANKTYSTVLNTMVPWTPEFIADLQQTVRFNDHFEGCQSFVNSSKQSTKEVEIFLIKYPQFEEYVPPPGKCEINEIDTTPYVELSTTKDNGATTEFKQNFLLQLILFVSLFVLYL